MEHGLLLDPMVKRWCISTIVVPLDLSPASKTAFEWGLQLAGLFAAEHIHLVHVIPDVNRWMRDVPSYSGSAVQDALAAMERSANERLGALTLLPGAGFELTREVRFGAPAKEIISTIEARRAELVVLASKRHSALGRALLGSVAHAVVRAAHCPVLVVREASPWKHPQRILAAIDLSAVSEHVVTRAIDVARTARGELEVFAVNDLAWVSPAWHDAAPLLLEAAERARRADAFRSAIGALTERLRDPEAPISRTIAEGRPPASMILEHTEKIGADLIVLGSSGHSAWQRFYLGSTVTRVLSHGEVPVLVVPLPRE